MSATSRPGDPARARLPADRLRAIGLAACLAALLAGSLAACDGGGGADPGDAADGADPSDGADASTPDAGDGSGLPDAGPEGAFELGTNPQGANQPADFVGLADGDDLEVVFGPQGLWMVVLAFRTRGLLEAPLLLGARLEVAGVVQGSLLLDKQKLFPGGDGYDYYYNFFLVVEDPGVAGQPGVVVFDATDARGEKVQVTREVALTGGT